MLCSDKMVSTPSGSLSVLLTGHVVEYFDRDENNVRTRCWSESILI